MNEQRYLLIRLLKLFPIKLVKEAFRISGGNASDAIDEITGSQTPDTIFEFSRSFQMMTKMHIYLFDMGSSFSTTIMNNFPIDIIKSSAIRGGSEYYLLPKVTYNVALTNPLEERVLEFLQPVTIRFHGKFMEVYFTKLEKKVSHFFKTERGAIRRGQDMDEEQILKIILAHIEAHVTVAPMDVNKGVKHLWEKNYIDARKVQSKRSSSTDTVVMDEEHLYKDQYPEDYDELINRPLGPTLFRYLKDDSEYCDNFDIDSTNGTVNIPKFSLNARQVKNVVSEILKFN